MLYALTGRLIVCWCVDVPGAEVQLPTLNVEDTDGDDGGRDSCTQGSRRPSKLTLEAADESVQSLVSDVAEIAALTVQQLEPKVSDPQLAEVKSQRIFCCRNFIAVMFHWIVSPYRLPVFCSDCFQELSGGRLFAFSPFIFRHIDAVMISMASRPVFSRCLYSDTTQNYLWISIRRVNFVLAWKKFHYSVTGLLYRKHRTCASPSFLALKVKVKRDISTSVIQSFYDLIGWMVFFCNLLFLMLCVKLSRLDLFSNAR